MCGAVAPHGSVPGPEIVWTFDRLENIGGVKTTVEGNPKVVDTPLGKAIEFDGVDDAIWIEKHPLAGAATFTFEAIFRPDGGAFEQRWFHLAERDPKTGLLASADHPKTGQDANPRFLFELRTVENNWYLDAFVNGPGYNHALIFKDKLHPVGQWYHVAQTYDGKMFRSYVNGVLQGEAEIAFKPQGEGRGLAGRAHQPAQLLQRRHPPGALHAARAHARSVSESDTRRSDVKYLVSTTARTSANLPSLLWLRNCSWRSSATRGGPFAQVTDQDLLKPNPANWLHYSGTYDSQRHSLLKQITPANVATLQAKWVYHLVGQQDDSGRADRRRRRHVHLAVQPRRRDRRSQRQHRLAVPAAAGEHRVAARHGRPRQQGVRDDDRFGTRMVALDARTGATYLGNVASPESAIGSPGRRR